jgi:hypothetical protein
MPAPVLILTGYTRTVNIYFYRAFCAWEEKVPVNISKQQAELRLQDEYKAKLILPNGDIIPDPFSLEDGWIGEASGISKWPSLYIMDIATFLNCNKPSDVVHRVLNEYKEGKAYRYFSCEWVKEIYFHPFRTNSETCLLRAKVTPSQSVNQKDYDVWVAVKKDSKSGPGGQVLSAYCTCTAGMLGTCNHVTGLLFRVEHAIKTGATDVSCTSKPCEWNIPAKTKIVPKKCQIWNGQRVIIQKRMLWLKVIFQRKRKEFVNKTSHL